MVAHQHPDTRCRMRLNILGHLEATVDDRPIALGGAKQRAILAMLGLEANRTVTADRLIEGLWGDDPPASAAKMVQNYVWRLRQVLAGDGGAEILTRGRGYELRIDRELVDVCRLERLVSEATRSAENGGPANGSAREALALFRGDPLADVADEPFAMAEIRRLEELRLTAEELAIEADLAAGRHQEVVGEIDALLAENPLRERLHGQRMLALYRCGRQAEALEAYRDARRTLVDEIGVEPTPELRRLHDAILRQDPSLDIEPAVTELPPELDPAASPPLIGRDDELRRLRAHWLHAAAGAGALVTLAGGYGMGKTRLAAELASEAQREGAAVRLRGGTGPPEAAPKAIARARGTRRPALIVIDNADRVPTDVRAALRALAPALGRLPVLVLATGQEAAALAQARAAGRDRPRAARRRGRPCHRGLLRARRRRAGARRDACWKPAAACRAASTRSHASGLATRPRAASTPRPDARQPGAPRRARSRPSWPEPSPTCSRCASAPATGRRSARRRSARTRAWRRSAPRTPSTSSGASSSSPSSSHGSSARRCSRSSGRRAAASRPSLRAGLLPALAGGVLPGSADWTQALIRPGEQPLRELAPRDPPARARTQRACSRSTSSRSCSRPAADEAERAEFVAALVRTARDREGRCVVVLAVRADFYGRCAAYPELSRLLGANHVLVGPMSRDELRRAIERPAQRVGLSVEPELVEALLTDVDGQPGRAAAAVDRAARALAAGATGRACASPRTRAAAASRAPSRGWPRTRSCGWTPRSRRRRASCCCASPTRTRAARSCAAGSSSPSSTRERSAEVVARLADRRLLTVARRRGRGRARGAAARMAAAARLARRGRRGPAPAPPARRRRARVGRRRPRPRRALPRRAPRLRARVGGRPRARAQRDRARVPGRQPARERARAAPPAHGARGRGLAARPRGDRRPGRARPARQRARRGDRGRGAAASARRRSRRTTSTARCCSPARAWHWTTRPRRAATCSPRCSRARRRSACCAATATG